MDFAYMSVYADFAVVSIFKQALSKDSWMLIFRFQLGIKYNWLFNTMFYTICFCVLEIP